MTARILGWRLKEPSKSAIAQKPHTDIDDRDLFVSARNGGRAAVAGERAEMIFN